MTVALLAAAVFLFGAAGALAEEARPQPLSVRLLWQSPGGCGSAERFEKEIRRRVPAVTFVERGEASVTLQAGVARRGRRFEGQLTAAGSLALVRRIRGESCADVLAAMVLVTALQLGAEEQTRPTGAAEPAPGAPTEASVHEQAPPEPASVPEPESALAPPTEAVPPAAAPGADELSPVSDQSSMATAVPAEERPQQRPPRGWGLAVGMSSEVQGGTSPALGYGGRLWTRVGWEQPGTWAPAAIVSLAHRLPQHHRTGDGEATFEFTTASLDLCPLRWRAAALHVAPCLGASGGRRTVSGTRTFGARSEARPWFNWQSTLHARTVGSWLEGDLSVGLVGPFERDSFQFRQAGCVDASCPARPFYRVRQLGWLASLGVGVAWQ